MRLSLVSVTLGSLLLTLSRYLVKRSSSSGCLNLDEVSNPSLVSPEEPSLMSGTTWDGSLIVFVKYLPKQKKIVKDDLVVTRFTLDLPLSRVRFPKVLPVNSEFGGRSTGSFSLPAASNRAYKPCMFIFSVLPLR